MTQFIRFSNAEMLALYKMKITKTLPYATLDTATQKTFNHSSTIINSLPIKDINFETVVRQGYLYHY